MSYRKLAVIGEELPFADGWAVVRNDPEATQGHDDLTAVCDTEGIADALLGALGETEVQIVTVRDNNGDAPECVTFDVETARRKYLNLIQEHCRVLLPEELPHVQKRTTDKYRIESGFRYVVGRARRVVCVPGNGDRWYVNWHEDQLGEIVRWYAWKVE